MTYTAWDYRKLAEYHEQLGNAIIAKHYLAHADALEENARLKAMVAGIETGAHDMVSLERKRAERAEAERDALRLLLDAPYHKDKKARFHAEAELAKLRQKLMRYEHAEAADILHPPQDEQARADFPEEK